ncbi:glycosyltransferase family 1 protein [Hyphomicrobiales bacterium 4NK60-0047b]
MVDLKPALDGYSGIPSECRLLFHGLMKLKKGHEVVGLLQHASHSLNGDFSEKFKSKNQSGKILSGAQSVTSFCQPSVRPEGFSFFEKCVLYYRLQMLRLNALLDRSIKLGAFDSEQFSDFIWRKMFSKSLSREAKDLVTSASYKIIKPSRGLLHYCGLPNFVPGLKAKYVKLDTEGYDVLIAQTPYPGQVTDQTKLVIRYHDAVPLLMPHTINSKEFHLSSHYHALKNNVEAGAHFVCNSEATQNDLLKLFPEVKSRTKVIYNIVSDDFYKCNESKDRVDQIIQRRLNTELIEENRAEALSLAQKNIDDYLLMVSTLEPRKNHALLVSAWERLRATQNENLKLILVGNWGWGCQEIKALLKPWILKGEIYHLSGVEPSELRVLYQYASVTICPSLFEGFDYSGVEAMRCGGVVAASDIEVHKEVYKNAAIYFDPYCAESASINIAKCLDKEDEALRNELLNEGEKVSEAYCYDAVLPHWESFLDNVIGKNDSDVSL